MWQKIKNILCIAGSVITILFFTVMLFLLRRGKTDGQGSNGDAERDSRIQEGIESSQERTERVEEGITRAEDGITKCEEHLQRAENILRRAIERSKEEKQKA